MRELGKLGIVLCLFLCVGCVKKPPEVQKVETSGLDSQAVSTKLEEAGYTRSVMYTHTFEIIVGKAESDFKFRIKRVGKEFDITFGNDELPYTLKGEESYVEFPKEDESQACSYDVEKQHGLIGTSCDGDNEMQAEELYINMYDQLYAIGISLTDLKSYLIEDIIAFEKSIGLNGEIVVYQCDVEDQEEPTYWRYTASKNVISNVQYHFQFTMTQNDCNCITPQYLRETKADMLRQMGLDKEEHVGMNVAMNGNNMMIDVNFDLVNLSPEVVESLNIVDENGIQVKDGKNVSLFKSISEDGILNSNCKRIVE